MLIKRFLMLVISVVWFNSAQAAPWVEPGDARLRHSLQLLNDFAVIDLPLTTWPVLWGDVSLQLDSVDRGQLPTSLQMAYDYVAFELAYHRRPALRQRVAVNYSSSESALRAYGDREWGEAEAVYQADFTSQQFSAQLSVNYRHQSSDKKDWSLDGSHIAYAIGNWVVSLGSTERWWGPGWHNSLIYSNNARPVPGIQLSRIRSDSFETPWLSWIGPWNFTAFAGQLEGSRHISGAKVIAMRLAVRPLQGLEMAFSRTAQWAGEGRPGDFSSLADLMLGIDNRGDDGVTADNEPGNQLGGLDFRYGTALADSLGAAFYGQLIGEDESGGLPSRYIGQLGLELSMPQAVPGSDIVLNAEYIDTRSGAIKGEPRYNYAYEHAIYRDGYRYFGRSLGAAVDSDSQALSLSAAVYLSEGQAWTFALTQYKLNRDAVAGGNLLSPDSNELLHLSLMHERNLGKGKIHVGVSGYDKKWKSELVNIDQVSAQIGWQYRF